MVILGKRVPGINLPALDRFVARAKRAVGLHGGVTVLVTTSRVLRALNRRFRRQDKATDVLAFPAGMMSVQRLAGDVAISADIAAQNARRLGHSPAEEVKILALHGMLHLAGHDHETDDGAMGRRERLLRRQLGLPVALIERNQRRADLKRGGERSSSALRRAGLNARSRKGTFRLSRLPRDRQ
jgi:probable rRNA maturation factor